MQMTDNVVWINTGHGNCYLCQDEDGLTLIDTGMGGKAEQIFAAVADWGYQPADLKRIIITHADIDHAGSMAAVQEKSGAVVLAGAETAELLLTGRSPEHLPAPFQFFLNTFVRYGKVNPDSLHVIRPGDVLDVLGGLEVIASPGHTRDHLAFFSPSTGILFAGDALSTRNDKIESSPKRITADEQVANETAVALLALSPAIIACGHGTPSTNHAGSDLMILFNELRSPTGG